MRGKRGGCDVDILVGFAGIGVVEHVGKGASLMGIPMGTFMEMPMAIPM